MTHYYQILFQDNSRNLKQEGFHDPKPTYLKNFLVLKNCNCTFFIGFKTLMLTIVLLVTRCFKLPTIYEYCLQGSPTMMHPPCRLQSLLDSHDNQCTLPAQPNTLKKLVILVKRIGYHGCLDQVYILYIRLTYVYYTFLYMYIKLLTNHLEVEVNRAP